MTNDDFIGRIMTGNAGRLRNHGNLFYEYGTIYSYGYHYPLAVLIIGNTWIVNDAGYSNTTRRHINIAKQYTDLYADLGRNRDTSVVNIIHQVQAELVDSRAELAGLRKNAFRKRERLENRIAELTRTEKHLEGVLNIIPKTKAAWSL